MVEDEIKKCRSEVDDMINELRQEVSKRNLTNEEIELIAETASEKAVKKMTDYIYLEVGKGVVAKTFKILGVIIVAMAIATHDKWFMK